MRDATQTEVLAFLADPMNHHLVPGEVKHFRTHLSDVFLAGDRAFKVKQAVRYAFVDLSTLAARHAACEAEFRLNVRTAPEIYLGVVALRRTPAGQLSLDEPGKAGNGVPVEWVVAMRRFDERLTMDRLADQNALRPEWIDSLVDSIIDMHDGAERHGAPYGGHGGLERTIDDNAADMAALHESFAKARLDGLLAAQRRLLARCEDPLDARRNAGLVRRCHGDLHLGNVVIWRDRPTIFDCIEFSDDLAIIDVAYDLAFLLMDLETRGLRPLACRALSRYLGRQGGVDALAALPLMMSLRATVRSKVTAMSIAGRQISAETERTAQKVEHLLRAAEHFAGSTPPPRLIAIGGLSGTGKTTLAAAVAPELGRAPGALHLRSDVIRKRLANVHPERRLPESAYTHDADQHVYRVLLQEAETALAAGQSVVADAVFGREDERRSVEAIAATAGVEFLGMWLDAPGPTLKERVAQRTRDASDATPDVVDRQLTYDIGAISWNRLDALAQSKTVLGKARAIINSTDR